MAVAGDPLEGITRVIDENLLGDNENPNGCTIPVEVHRPVWATELHQVQTREIARGIIEEHVLAARVRRIDRPGLRTGVPVVDRRVILHARVATKVRTLCHLSQQILRVVCDVLLAIRDVVGLPFLIVQRGLHELVGYANRKIRVLEHHRLVGLATKGTIVALLDQRPGLFLLDGLGFDELQNIRVIATQRLHLRRPTRLATRLDHRGDLVVHPHETQRA